MITQDRLKELFDYDQITGILTWKYTRGGRVKGTVAGTKRKDGYIVICIEKRFYLAHRIAWVCVTGELPVRLIDHINGDPSDNRICNLREATDAQNSANAKIQSNNSSGIKGVCFNKSKNKWMARIDINRRTVHLGYFVDKEEAGEFYDLVARTVRGEFHSNTRR